MQLVLGTPSTEVACPIDSVAIGRGREAISGPRWIVHISLSQAHPADDNLPNDALGQQSAARVNHL